MLLKRTMVKRISENKKIRNDIILVAVILLLTAAGVLILNLTKNTGDIVSVKIDGAEKMRYFLSEDTDTVIRTDDGQMNHLIIKNGEAYISDADCPDKICVKHRPVKNVNESIVCLPHKVVIEIISADETGLDMAV